MSTVLYIYTYIKRSCLDLRSYNKSRIFLNILLRRVFYYIQLQEKGYDNSRNDEIHESEKRQGSALILETEYM